MVGKTVSHYKILEELGRGGMGVVYKAEDTKLKRTVALKFLPPEFMSDSEAKQRFLIEAQAAAALDHPNICAIHEIEEGNGQTFMVMGFIEGRSLEAKIKGERLKIKEVLDIALQIAEGLKVAHEHGIIHRDIKPANIMITKEGRAKILDFGLAKLSGLSQLTRSGATLGTTAYMSPEQARGEPVDQRTDIWSFGVVLYQMLTGQLPFEGEYEQAIIYSILHDEPEAPSSFREDIPQDLEQIVLNALQKEPRQRFSSMAEMIPALRELQNKSTAISKAKAQESKKTLPSIAVLPFTNISADPEQEYFCDGMAEEIINALTQIEGLRVVARTSAFAFKGKNVDVREIGKILNVTTVLEGSVRKAGKRVRVTAQLIKVADGYHLWSEKYDRDLEDIFAVQDEISQKITHQLKGKLFGEEKEKLVRKPVENMEAYELLLKGRYFMNQMTRAGLNKGIDYFQQAIERLPDFAEAYANMASCYSVQAMLGYLPSNIAMAKAKTIAQKALSIDPNQVTVHSTLGLAILYHDWDWQGAKRELDRARALNPNHVNTHIYFSLYYQILGKVEDALREAQQAAELDPISTIIIINFAVHLVRANKLKQAKKQIAKIFELVPDHPYAHYLSGQIAVLQGEYEKAFTHYEKSMKQSGQTHLLIAALGWAHGKAGNRQKALEFLKKLEAIAQHEAVSPVYFTRIYIALKDFDKAFDYLEKAYQEHDSSLLNIRTEESIWDLHGHPRFLEFLKKMGLDD